MIKGVKLKRNFAIVFCVALLFNFFAYPSTEAETLSSLKEEVKTITHQREKVETEITDFEEQIKFMEEQITKLDYEIQENEIWLKKVEAELEIQQSYLAENLKVLYIEDQKSLFELLVEARTFSDFVDRNEYLNIFREKLKATADSVANLKNEAELKKQILSQAKAIQNSLKTSLEKQKAEKEVILGDLEEEERRIRDKFAERLSRQGNTQYCQGEGAEIKAKYSIFSFPVKCGYISQGFGMTEFASIDNAYNGAPHNGFDVGIESGAEIRAIGTGTVYARGSSPSGGWGNWVMIKHNKARIEGNDIEFYSLYAHMVAETHMEIGEKVDSNTVIGFVGGTPYWASHLHLSLFLSSSGWSNGKTGPYPGNAVDPLNYMNIPISTNGTDWDLDFAH